MANQDEQKLKTWAILEIMGHQRYAGLVSEQPLAGAALIRIDVPEIPAQDGNAARPAFTKMFGVGSIFCLTPVSEAVARQAARNCDRAPLIVLDAYRQPTLEHFHSDLLECRGMMKDDDFLPG